MAGGRAIDPVLLAIVEPRPRVRDPGSWEEERWRTLSRSEPERKYER